MKKLIVSMFALGAILASCSKSDVTESLYENNPISFDTYNGRTPEVKATSIDGTNMTTISFQAIGEKNEEAKSDKKYFNKAISNKGKGWEYEGVAYWPTDALNFYAYSLNCGSNLTADHTIGELTLTVPNSVKDQKDFLVATPVTGKKYDNTKGDENTVTFNFSHMLSRVHFSLLTGTGNTTVVQITDISVKGNFASGCKVNYKGTDEGGAPNSTIAATEIGEVTYKYLDGTNNQAFFGYGAAEEPIYNNKMLWNSDSFTAKTNPSQEETASANEAEANRYMMIVPSHKVAGDEVNPHNAEISVTYKLLGAGTYTATKSLKDIPFRPGYSYNIILKVSLNTISFSVEINDWTDYPSANTGTEITLE